MDGKYIVPDGFTGMQRNDVLDIDTIFMSMAVLMSAASKDPSTQVGAVIVNSENRVLTLGYNGTPIGWKDSEFTWGKDYADEAKEFEKYGSVVHAEVNAIRNYTGTHDNFKGSTAYVTLFPCEHCATILTQFGVKKIVYLSDKYKKTVGNRQAKRTFQYCGIEYVQFDPKKLIGLNVSLMPDVGVDKIEKGNGRQRGRK